MKLRAVKKHPATYTPPLKKRRFSWGKLIYASILVLLAWAGLDKLYRTYSQVEAVGILVGEEVSIESPFAARILRIELVVGQAVTKNRECVFFDKTDMEREVIEKEGELPRLKAELAREKNRISAHIDKENARLELEEKKLQSSKKALYTRLMRLNKEVEVQDAERNNFEAIKEQKEKLVRAGALTKNDLLAVQFQLDPIRRRLAGYTKEIEGLREEISGLDETIGFLSDRKTDAKNEILKQSLAPVISEKIRQAEIEIESRRVRLKSYILTSPIDGIVAEVLKKPGEIAGPRLQSGEALIEVRLAGICNTDLEIAKGYMDFRGIPGHEFVGVVLESPDDSWVGKRVVGEINCPCKICDLCRRGLSNHCHKRTVLGIHGRDGAFAERLCLPLDNLHLVPDSVPDEVAVFTEPLAAAFEIIEQVQIKKEQSVLVMGDGKLGLLCAQVIRLTGCGVVLIGKHRAKLDLLDGISAYLPDEVPQGKFDVVVEATGSAEGFSQALSYLHPKGTLVLKSTVTGKSDIDLAPLVIDEITVVGSRCGPFNRALEALMKNEIKVDFLIETTYPLGEADKAWEHAGRRGTKKILLTNK